MANERTFSIVKPNAVHDNNIGNILSRFEGEGLRLAASKFVSLSKEKAEKISKIAFTLQSTIDQEKGGEISENLTWLYRFIRYMAKRIQDNDDMNYVQPAYKICESLKEGWDGIPVNVRH